MNKKLTAISFFSGAMGLDLGLEKAGFDIKLCIELDKSCQNTIRKNIGKLGKSNLPILDDITKVTYSEILNYAGLKKSKVDLIAGGPPCQAFSTAGKRASINDPRGVLVSKYLEFIDEIRPRFFVFENVRGILSASIKHRPLDKRGPSHLPLRPNEELGSLLNLVIIPMFDQIGYEVKYGLIDTADFGIAQNRLRVFFLGSRDHEFSKLGLTNFTDIILPTHSKNGDGQIPWITLGEVLKKIKDKKPEFQKYSNKRAEVLEKVPEGENWRYLRDKYGLKYLKEIMGGAYESSGGKVGFWRRLSSDKPSPTLTTSPIQKSTSLCHPFFTRPLSVKEYAAIQDFPDYWEFAGSISQKYKQIGNAVPVGMGKAIGKSLINVIKKMDSVKIKKSIKK